MKDIDSKLALTEAAISASSQGVNAISRAYLIFVALGEVDADITRRVFVSSGGKVIAFVLDKARVERWIGPSLFTRPQFVQTQLDSSTKDQIQLDNSTKDK